MHVLAVGNKLLMQLPAEIQVDVGLAADEVAVWHEPLGFEIGHAGGYAVLLGLSGPCCYDAFLRGFQGSHDGHGLALQ